MVGPPRVLGTLLVVVAALATPARAQLSFPTSSLVARIDSLAEATLREGPVAGLAVGVRQGDEVLLARGYGVADIENSVPATSATVYRIGSLTKQFTAAAVMQLVERGLVGLDRPMTDYLPEYPAQGYEVTVRDLLTHSSGIRSYTSLGDTFAQLASHDLSDEELVALFAHEPFDFEPDERFLYNNSGYYLLGMIIGRVSGETYREYLANHVFLELGLDHSSYCDERPIIPGRAEGYEAHEGHLVNDDLISMNIPGAAGALCSTVPDLLTWSAALRSGRVVSPESYEAMTTSDRLRDGSETGYGFGLGVGMFEEHRRIAHTGGINGFTTMMTYYPDAEVDIVVLSNTGNGAPTKMEAQIARWMLGGSDDH